MRPIVLTIAIVVMAAFYVLWDADMGAGFIVLRRLVRLGGMIVGGTCIALSSILFQTIAQNRILTPAIMGYEAVYVLLQSMLILILGTASLRILGDTGNAALSILLMLTYSWAIHRWLFRDGKYAMSLLLLVGLVLTLVLGTIAQFIQLRISPGEFSIVQSFTLMSFDNISWSRLALSAVLTSGIAFIIWRRLDRLDVMAFGREQAISLGIDHRRETRHCLGLIAILVAVSTSLLGPSAFMGIFVANIAYALGDSFRHRVTLPLGCLIAIAMFLLAELLVQHLFNHRTTVGILINLICGGYFLLLVTRPRQTA